MGNRNSRPHQGLTTDKSVPGSEEQQVVVRSKQQALADPDLSLLVGQDQAPPCGPITTLVGRQHSTEDISNCLVLPSRNTTTTTNTNNHNKNNDISNSALPHRAIFSASLERSLSSRKQASVLLRSCSSWTAGHDAATRSAAITTEHSALSSADNNKNVTAAQPAGKEEGNIDSNSSVGTIQGQTRRGQSDPTRTVEKTTQDTGRSKDSSSDTRWREVLRGRHQYSPRVQRQGGTEKSASRQCQSTASSPAAKIRPPPTASDRPREPSNETRKDNPARRRSLHSREKPPQQRDTRGRYATTAGRGGRGRTCGLSMVKCWEGGVAEKAEGTRRGDEDRSRVGRVVRRRGREEEDAQRSRRRTTDDSNTPIAEVGGRDRGGRRDDNPCAIGTGHGRAPAASGQTLNDETARVRQQQGKGRRAAGARTTRHVDDDDTAAMDDDEKLGKLSSLQQLPSTTEDGCDCESLSVSSANSLVAQELSVSSLPPMGTATMATDLIFEESYFEDSGTSLSLASSSDRNCLDGASRGASGVVGEGCGGGRRKRSPTRRQRRGSSDDIVRTRSVGRGLSTVMARIHEKEECVGVGQSTREAAAVRHRGSSVSDKDSLRVQDLLDSDSEALEVLSATASSPAAAVPWAAAAANSTINVGHQRAALELRNLTLEREVEQLKTHLRNMGGEDLAHRQRQGLRRPRPRQQRVDGERALAGSAAATTLAGSMPTSSLSARKATTTVPAAIPTPTSRLVAPLPLAETALTSISHRGGSGSSGIGGGGGDSAGRRKTEIGRARRSQNYRGGRGSTGNGTFSPRDVAAFGEDGGGSTSGPSAQAAPSPPRKRHHHSSDTRPLVAGIGVSPTASTTGTVPSSSANSSPGRQPRSVRLRSPDSASSSGVVGAGPERVRLGGAAVGPAPLSPRKGNTGVDRSVHGSSLNAAGLHQKKREADDKPGSDLVHIAAEDSPRVGSEARPLPRLRGEEVERRRGVQEKPRASKSPICLGGVVSGIKHTLLGRRRSTGAMNVQLVAPAGSTTAQINATTIAVRRNGGRRGRSLAPHAVVNKSNVPSAGTDASTAAKEAITTTTAIRSDRGNIDGGKRTYSSRHLAREENDHIRSSSMASTNADAVETTTANQRHHQRRGRGTETLLSRGAAEGSGGGKEKEVEGRLTVVRVRQASGDDRQGLSSAITTSAAMATHEPLPPATRVADGKQEAVAAAATTGTTVTVTATAKGTVSVAESSATTAVPSTVTHDATDIMKEEAAYERWPATLDARWAEVEFMLCREVESEESLRYTTEATQAGLVFMEKLAKKAQELGVLKGQLSRWLLPYNTDTSVDEQQAATPRRFQESLQASVAASSEAGGGGGGGGGGTLTEQEAEYLTAGARRVRQLVRLKIADDNDLNTAKEALTTMAGFFVSISEEAATRGGSSTAFSVLQERRAMSPITRPPPLPSITRPPAAISSPAAATDHATTSPATAAATTTTTPNTTTTSIERNNGSSQASGGGRMVVSPAAPAAMPYAPGERLLPRGAQRAGRGAEPTAVPGGEARRRAGNGVSLPLATAATATKSPRCVDPAVVGDVAGTSARGGTSSTVIGTAVAHAGAPIDSDTKAEADVLETGAGSGGTIRKVGGGSTGGPPSRLLKGATAAAAAAAAVCDTGRVAVERSPRYGSTGEVSGVAPPGSLERLKRRTRLARSRSTTQR